MASKKKTSKKTVTFIATKMVPQNRRVSFTTNEGKRVTFKATKMVLKKDKVTFKARRK